MSKTFNKAVFETFVIPTETFSSMKTDFEKFSYKLTGNYNFGVIVFIVPAKFSCDSFTAIPIEGWGKKYIIFTIYAYSTISVTTYQDNKITFNLKACPTVSKSEDQFIEYQGRKLVDGDSFDVVLPALKTFALMLCERVIFGSMTGTEITSEKIIGVVSGNCYAGTLSFGCNGQMSASQEWGTMDIAAEMMMPVESYGKEFIMLYMPRRRRQGFHTVTAAFPDTTIQIGNGGGSETFENIVLKDARSNADLVFTDVRHLKSDKPVLVVYVQESQCTRAGNLREKGDPSLTIIIPMNLFYDIYVWSAPKTDVVKPLGYVIVQVKKTDRDFLLFDNQPMPPGTKWVDVIGNDEYTYGDTSIMEGLHNVTGSRFFYFGCYIYGLSDYYSYMNPAGFISSEINMPCTPNRADMQNGDLIDNDCDGSIDEELADGIDNDNDKKVDEDLTRAAPS
ncbi:uncharacterized protein LOC131947624 [Physella acuta]|uniref:uncharacterized protein LOC131947624 n=1 Tax=Physella acuta TaxID=109671 RepID=UPI0027DCF822|nr:uncharacterized protein LOC131947624 [Physella acuta]